MAGSVQCNERGGGCAGSADGHCWPNNMWSGVPVSSTQYHSSNLNTGGFYMNQHVPTYAFSVRCVQDLRIYKQPKKCVRGNLDRLSQALYSAAYYGAAVRALTMATATRMLCGQVLLFLTRFAMRMTLQAVLFTRQLQGTL